jgi:multiple sugar transport system ATP-binding protein
MGSVTYDRVSKKFDDVSALNNLVLNIQDGEFLVLVGPSGCGKSTALRCLAGLEEVTSGDIRISERSVTHVEPKDRDIAMVFQNYALYPHMNVRDNLSFGLKLRKTPKDEIKRRIQEASEILGIGELLDRQPRQLSGGQRQRVALGRAIVREPQVFLMDEPLSNLDAKLRVQTRAELTQLQNRLKTTTLYVTHDQVEAMTMGDRIAVMNFGVLQQLDTPQNLYDNPANLFVATFIGSPAMNVFSAEAVANNGTVRVVADGIDLTVPESRSKRLQNHINKKVFVGIRPESFSLVQGEEGQNRNQIDGRRVNLEVTLVEPLGSDTLVHLRGPEDCTIVARLDPHDKVKASEVPKMTVDLDLVHFFDIETEQALG